MKERPILFSAPMVRAILDGRKTQTRRILKPAPLPPVARWIMSNNQWVPKALNEVVQQQYVSTWPMSLKCPYGIIGDRLWVRETFAPVYDSCEHPELPDCPKEEWITGYAYKAYGVNTVDKWKPSIFMPRAASRITLEITNVRVERLQDISESDAKAEGVIAGCSNCGDPVDYDNCKCGIQKPEYRDSYIWLWNEINGKDAWNKNPWVWVIEFRRIK